jgi:hypothetical protein
MYKWLMAGCLIGFGIGLIVASTLFETWLSPFGNPITIEYTTWDWGSQVSLWRYIGIMWLFTGVIATYLVYKLGKKTVPSKTLRKHTPKKTPSMPTTTTSTKPSVATTTTSVKPSIESPKRKRIVIRNRYLRVLGLIAFYAIAFYTIFAAIFFVVGLASIPQLAILALAIGYAIITAIITISWRRRKQKSARAMSLQHSAKAMTE